MATPHAVLLLPATEAPDALLIQSFELMKSIWPTPESQRDFAAAARNYVESTRAAGAKHCFVVRESQLLAHARIFARPMFAGERVLNVGCLAGVCVRPEWRGHQLGRAVVEAAFSTLEPGGLEAALFQTAVPDFYRRLGARTVTNTWKFGSAGPGTDWWEPFVMVYPATADWPEGCIDIGGPGF